MTRRKVGRNKNRDKSALFSHGSFGPRNSTNGYPSNFDELMEGSDIHLHVEGAHTI
jgi:hypothetical protein